MSVSTTSNRISYAGNGATTAFSFPYKFLANGDLVVVLRVNATTVETTKTITTHYTATGAGGASGGTVTMITAPATGETLIIYDDPAATQGVDLVENDSSPAETKEGAWDRLTIIAQRLKDRLDRTVRLTDGFSPTFNPNLPSNLNEAANKVPLINSGGTGFADCDDWPTADDIENAEEEADAAAASAVAAASSQTAAAASAAAALVSETNAAAQLASSFWRDVIYVTSADSPITITAATHNGKAIAADSSGGAITINLPSIAALTPPFNFGVVLKTAGNNVTIARNGSDTIMGATSKVLSIVNTGCQLIADTGGAPDDWTSLDFGTVADLGVTTAKLAALSVTEPKLAQAVFSALTTVVGVPTDHIPIADASDSGNKKKSLVSDLQVRAYRSVTTTDSPTIADGFMALSGASFTVTLPAVAGVVDGFEFEFYHGGTSLTQVYTIDGSGAETVGGVAALTLNSNGEYLRIRKAGSAWLVIVHRGFDIELFLDGQDGHGSTDTKIMSYDTAQKNTLGVYATYADTAAAGMTVTMLVGGMYAFESGASQGASSEVYAITVNEGATLTTNASTPLTYAQGVRIRGYSPTAVEANVAGTIKLFAGDVVRCHDDGASDDTSVKTYFKMLRIG